MIGRTDIARKNAAVRALSESFCRFLPAGCSPEAAARQIDSLIELALAEDISTGDITGLAVVPEGHRSKAKLVLKEGAAIAGLEIFQLLLSRICADLSFTAHANEAQYFESAPVCIASMEGNSRALLAGERSALNLIQRLSGIATVTGKLVAKARPYGIEILDTRKTTPGLRLLEKWAVKAAGGTNHRFGLYDLILIKDNHRAIAGSVTAAVEAARQSYPQQIVEVEVNTLEQLAEALELKAERVMLDNMPPEQIKEAVELAAGRTYIEVSGGVNQSNLENYLIPGVNGISMGALTHSVKSIDISLEFED